MEWKASGPSPPTPSPSRGRGGLKAKFFLDEVHQVIGVKGGFGGDAKDCPSIGDEFGVALGVTQLDFGQFMNAAINLDDEPRARDGEIYDDSMDGMLAADGEAVIAQGAEGLPGDVFRHVG